jgi:hypothetical protein
MSTVHIEPVGQTISVLSASAFAINAFHYLIEHHLNSYVAFAFVLPSAVLVHSFTEYLIVKLPMRSARLRKLIMHTANVEGYWFQVVHSVEAPYSIVCIEYDSSASFYVYHGVSYRTDGSRNASFRSFYTCIDDAASGLTFHYEATVHDSSATLQAGGTAIAKGYGKINFFTEGSGSYIRGEGEFFERKPEPNWRTFELYRISQNLVDSLEMKHAADDRDYDRLLELAQDQRNRKAAALNPIGRNSQLGLSNQPPSHRSQKAFEILMNEGTTSPQSQEANLTPPADDQGRR